MTRQSWRTILRGAVIAIAMAASAPAWADKARPAVLSPDDRADIARIEQYLQGLTTLTAHFTQVASTGDVSRGRFYLSRPGKMRFEYDPPVPVLLVATGSLLIYVDKELQQVSQVLQSTTPLNVLVRKKVDLDDGMTVIGFQRRPGVLRITLTETDNPEEGSISLVFAERPMALRQWQVKDAQGVVTTVTLSSVRRGMALADALFHVDTDSFNQYKPQ